MSLRTRFALGMAVLVAAAIALTGWFLVDNARDELIGEVDSFLVGRAEQLVPFDEVVEQAGRRGGRLFDRRAFGAERFAQDDSVAQVVLANGNVRALTETLLPVVTRDLELATATGREQIIRDVEADGVEYRVLTTSLGPVDAALMIGRDLTEVNAALDGLRSRTIVSGVVGALVAALVGWLIAGRLSRPVQRLTAAAEHVASTQDLSASIEAVGGDEVGRLGRSFNTMLEALDTSRQQQQRLVMDASHELRTPLTSVRTNVDVLRRASSISDDDRQEMLEDMARELNELTTLVDELVELSTSSRRPAEEVVPVDLGEIAHATAERARRALERAVDVRLEDPATIDGHRSLLDRAVWNLVDNAAKFSDPGTSIDLAVVGNKVTVRDHGRGIPDEDRNLVFERFYRSIETRSDPGSGLGLSIVDDIVRSHGGECFVEDPPDGPGVVVGFEVSGLV